MNNSLPAIEKLKGVDDYNDWKFAMEAYLQHEGLWEYVIEAQGATDAQKQIKAKSRIILSVDKSIYSHIRKAETAKQAWDSIKAAFEDSGLTRKVGLLRILTSTRLENFSNVEEYVNKIFDTAQKLESFNFKVDDEWIGALLLTGLPEKYKPMIMGLESSGTQLTGQVIKAKLLQDVQIEENSSSDTAFFTNNNNKYKSNYRNNNNYKPNNNNYNNNRKRFNNTDNKYKNQKFYTCNKYGHISSICRSNPNNRNKTEQGNLCVEEDV